MELRAEDITIAITVYSRRDYVCDAIRSALAQTVPVKVIVVEDCGPDPTLQTFIRSEFGDRITYYRNPKNRGLFDNWHACMEYSETPWLSILHDDDMLRPEFVATILAMARQAPGRALYFGRHSRLEEDGQIYPPPPVRWPNEWQDIDLNRLLDECFLLFPGQLFRIEDARKIGGFRTNSHFTGDWDMWFRLTLESGGAQSAKELAVVRTHDGIDRGTSVVIRKGWKWALDNVQRKRNLARWRGKNKTPLKFDRAKLLQESPIATRLLLPYAKNCTRRILAYNWWLFVHSKPPHFRYAVFQCLARICGPNLLRMAGKPAARH
jgi:glycosyltransferase involved in cell wall biosynthesis